MAHANSFTTFRRLGLSRDMYRTSKLAGITTDVRYYAFLYNPFQ